MLPEERARDWLVREDTVDHPGAYRLRLIASGTAEEIIASLERVLHELRSEAPTLDGLNAGSALCDWDIDGADAINEACPAREDTVGERVGHEDPTIECVNCRMNVALASQCSACGHCPGCGAPPDSHCDCRYNHTNDGKCICQSCVGER